ncbi:MAG: hypothetical protein PHP64_06580 [Actinomycetota bacterium]|nr:hypothetical protein [Actinomycetota bacterium]
MVESRENNQIYDNRRKNIGGLIAGILGIVFGMSIIVAGSFLTWRSDSVLGLYSQSGIHVEVITSSDGIITLILGILGFLFLFAGVVTRRWFPYSLAFICSLITLILSLTIIIILSLKTGITGPGHGLYTIVGGSVAGIFCSLTGYQIFKTPSNN